jgi:uncharacterized repeat protein (TIGR03803 family)
MIASLCTLLLGISTPVLPAATLMTLYTFSNFPLGANPEAGLIQGSDGNFYGTMRSGGTNGGGMVFKMTSNGALTTLYSFSNSYLGATPTPGLIQGSDGNFYGTTGGGESSTDGGTIFKITSNGVLMTLYSFANGWYTANPFTAPVQGRDGNFYGTTFFGGTNGGGMVFNDSEWCPNDPLFIHAWT